MKNNDFNEAKFHSLGASFLVAYLYFRLVDNDYNGWRSTATSKARANQIKVHRKEVFRWLQEVKKCHAGLLEQNEMGLSYSDIMNMLNAVERNWVEEF